MPLSRGEPRDRGRLGGYSGRIVPPRQRDPMPMPGPPGRIVRLALIPRPGSATRCPCPARFPAAMSRPDTMGLARPTRVPVEGLTGP